MNWQRILVPLAGAALVAFAYRSFGWPGVALVAGGMLMWVLLHFTRLTQVLKRAADRPIGYVGSAVMLNAKLRPNLTLLHVIGLARALGEQLSPTRAAAGGVPLDRRLRLARDLRIRAGQAGPLAAGAARRPRRTSRPARLSKMTGLLPSPRTKT